ncbi:hypothetical protein BDD12DRAFT_907891 [Trichophaea hybrida]|nr:hypothetical protein BDD12DRAFT_907891 [Trichophaea hybrida]
MDHFSAPDGTEPIDIPWVDFQEYDGGDFESYPDRQGWRQRLLDGDPVYTGKFADDAVPFFQTWLFFGCLIKVFEAVGINVRTQDFVREKNGIKYITTKSLPRFIQQWKDQNHYDRDISKCFQELSVSGPPDPKHFQDVMSKRIQRVEDGELTIQKILKDVDRVSRTCCNKESRNSSPQVSDCGRAPIWSLPSKISMSILALRWTLADAACRIKDSNVKPLFGSWWHCRALEERFLEAGWCPSEIFRFMNRGEVDVHYYISSFRCPRWEDDHTCCTLMACNGRRAGNEQYSTKHVSDCKGCENFRVADEKSYIEIIKAGRIPLVSWSESQDGGELRVEEHKPDETRYVAISHVWSDGMGNEDENSLPRCQLIRLQRLVDDLNVISSDPGAADTFQFLGPKKILGEDAPKKIAGFWMDTLCVPIRENENYRKSAIAMMRKIYEEAYRVLVLDSWIQEVPSTSSLDEKSARLYLSNWQRRLWTCQEGVLAQALYFQFKDRPQTKRNLFDEAERRKRSGTSISISNYSLPTVPVFSLEHDITEMRGAVYEKFEPVLHTIRQRNTTKMSDETVCIATLMNLDPTPLLQIKSGKSNKTVEEKREAEKKVHEKRMQELLGMVGRFYRGFIFNKYPRLQSDGFRWAPASYLNKNISGEDPFYNQKVRRNLGPAYLSKGGGLVASYPGIRLGRVGSHLGKVVNVVRLGSTDNQTWYRISLEPDEHGEYPLWDANSRYGVISCVTPRHKTVTEAILGFVDRDEVFDPNEDNSDSDDGEYDEGDGEDNSDRDDGEHDEGDGEDNSNEYVSDGADNDGEWEDDDDDEEEEGNWEESNSDDDNDDDDDEEVEGGSDDELPEEDGICYSNLRYICRIRIERLEEKDLGDAKREWALHLQFQKEGKVGDESKVYNKDTPVFGQWLENDHEWCVR